MSEERSSEWPPPSMEDLMKRCYVLIDTETGELAWGDTYWDGWIYSNWLTAQREGSLDVRKLRSQGRWDPSYR